MGDRKAGIEGEKKGGVWEVGKKGGRDGRRNIHSERIMGGRNGDFWVGGMKEWREREE